MYKLKNLKHIFAITVIVLGIVLITITSLFADITIFFNKSFIYNALGGSFPDTIYHHTLQPHAQSKIILIKIDDESMNYLEANNIVFGKNIYSRLVERLERAQVRGIGFDIIFGVPDTAPSGVANLSNEEEFVNIMKQYDNIVIATNYDDQFCPQSIALLKRIYPTLDDVSESTYPGSMTTSCPKRLAGILVTNKNKLTSYDQTKKYATFFAAYEAKGGTLDNFTDEEYRTLFCEKDDAGSGTYESCLDVPRSVYRDIPWGMININKIHDISFSRPTVAFLSSNLPYASWKTASGHLDGQKYVFTLPLELYRLTGGDISRYNDATVMLNPYFGPEHSFTEVSLMDVLQYSNSEMLTVFQGAHVLVGNYEKGNHDSIVTPVTGKIMAGVELHAHFLDGLLQQKMLFPLDSKWVVASIVLAAIIMVLLYFISHKYLSPIIAIIVYILIIWTSRWLYDVQRVLVDILPYFVVGIGSYIVTYVYKFFVVDREKRALQSNFAHYVDPHVVDTIVQNDEPIELGGEKRELTVLFSDIAGFTTISEKLPPQELFYLMTSYLSTMTDILIHEGGTLDKYIGDAVMGFFGAPLRYSDHAIRACRTALAMVAGLPTFNHDIVNHGIDPISFRVGIATGEVMVGNIGSHDRFNYTVLGDTVNLASRLESAGKEYGVTILISESVKIRLPSEFYVRELDTIAVKGKHDGVRIYELVGFQSAIDNTQVYTRYETALQLYREGKYHEAGELWATQMSLDAPSRVMVERCMAIVRGEVIVENGIYRMMHK